VQRAAVLTEAQRRIAAQDGVTGVAYANRMPGFNHIDETFEIEGDTTAYDQVRVSGVDEHFFDVVGARIIAGRGFRPEDRRSELGVAIVASDWAREVFVGRSPLGQRIRYPERPDAQGARWYEVVGVVDGMTRAGGPGSPVAVFEPLRLEEQASAQLYVRTSGAPETLAPQLHELILAVDPAIAIANLQPLDVAWQPVQRSDAFFAGALSVVAGVLLLFALVGIFALMSFTVSQRAREIGIRAALGADPRRLVLSIFSRAFGQIALGVIVGGALVSVHLGGMPGGLALVGSVAGLMVAFGLIGCVLPALRALRIQPTQALRAE
jgi:hypothetical protein